MFQSYFDPETNTLPSGATLRFRVLTQAGIGGGSLYRHRDLWHPEFLNLAPPVENPPDPPATFEDDQSDCAVGASHWHNLSSLLSSTDGNHRLDMGLSDREEGIAEELGGNTAEHGDLPAGAEGIQSMLFDVKAWLETSQEAVRAANEQTLRIRAEAQHQAHVERMQQFLFSGDSILMAEAIAWSDINPGVLDEERLAMLSLRDAVHAFLLGLQGLLPRMQGVILVLFASYWQFEPDGGSGRNA